LKCSWVCHPLQSLSPFGVVPESIEVESVRVDTMAFPPSRLPLLEFTCLTELASDRIASLLERSLCAVLPKNSAIHFEVFRPDVGSWTSAHDRLS
jgi:hypothetical protein